MTSWNAHQALLRTLTPTMKPSDAYKFRRPSIHLLYQTDQRISLRLNMEVTIFNMHKVSYSEAQTRLLCTYF
jgi:hypothetical protein